MNSNTHTLQHYRRLRAQRQKRSPYIKGMFTPPPLTHDNFLIYSITALGSGCFRPRPQHASCAPRGLAATGRGFARACGSPLQAGHVWADIASVSNIATNTPPSGRTFFFFAETLPDLFSVALATMLQTSTASPRHLQPCCKRQPRLRGICNHVANVNRISEAFATVLQTSTASPRHLQQSCKRQPRLHGICNSVANVNRISEAFATMLQAVPQE